MSEQVSNDKQIKEERIDRFLTMVRERMVAAIEVKTEIRLGAKRRWADGNMFPDIQPNGTCTITIEINGGCVYEKECV